MTWERTPDGRFRAWVVDRPDVTVTSKSWRDAADRLTDRVDNELHAGEWTADWFPPGPFEFDARVTVDQTYVKLIPDERHCPFNDPATLYSERVCPTCATPRGTRTNVRLATYVESATGLAFGRFGESNLISESAAQLLGTARLGGAELREVDYLKRSRTKYFELVVPDAVPAVAIKPPADYFGNKCPTCGYRYFSHRYNGNEYFSYVSASSIPRDADSFWVDETSRELCVRQSFWRTVCGNRALRGVITNPLLVIDDDDVEPDPPLGVRDFGPSNLKSMKEGLARFAEGIKLPAGVGDWLRA